MSKRVVISSTVRDLPEHREKALDAVLRHNMTPLMMEHLPSSDADAIGVSMGLIDQAHIYVGVFGFRYGHVPERSAISITEMEYDRAVERGIPRLLFLMDEQHLIRLADVDKEATWTKISAFRDRLVRERAGRSFRSAEELRSEMIHALSRYSSEAIERPFMAPTPDEKQLFGREPVLEDIRKRLLGGSEVVALYGLPGVGKTALATVTAHDLGIREKFPDGVLWAGLGQSGSVFAALGTWQQALGIRTEQAAVAADTAGFARVIQDHIAGRRMLLVIDGVWDEATIGAFRIGSSGSAHLVTTPFPSIANRTALDAIEVKGLEPRPATEFLRHIAPRATMLSDAAAGELVRHFGGLPLGIRLLGLHLQSAAATGGPPRLERSVARLLEDARSRLQLDAAVPLVARPTAASAPNVSLDLVMRAIATSLQRHARRVLSALAVLPPSPSTFSAQAALAVSAGDQEDLDRLLDAGLLNVAAGDRYAMHTVVRDFAAPRNPLPATQRLVEFAVDYCRTYRSDVAALEREADVITTGWRAADRADARAALVVIATAAADYFRARGAYGPAVGYLRRAEEAARKAGDTDSLIAVLEHLGHIAEKQGDYDDGERRLEEALALSTPPSDSRRAHLLYLLGVVAWDRSDYSRAQELLNEARELASANPAALVPIEQRLGLVAREQGQPAVAREYAESALARARPLPHGEEMVTALLTDLAVLALQRDDLASAALHISEGLALAREIRHTERTVGLLQLSSALARRSDDAVTAESDLREALALARQISHRWYLTTCLIDWGRLQGSRGEVASARLALDEARDLSRNRIADLHAFAGFRLAQLLFPAEPGTALMLARESADTLTNISHAGVAEVNAWLSSVAGGGDN